MIFIAEENKVKVLGRTLMLDGIRYLNYSASEIEFEFVGKKAEAVIWSNGFDMEDMFKAWIAVYINGQEEPSKRIRLDKEEDSYLLYESDMEEKITIRLVKVSEAAFGKVGIKSIYIDSLNQPVPGSYKNRKIEFIGDSITCGYGNEGIFNVDTFHTAQENPYDAYAVKTARKLNADYHLVSWSGIGIISRWVEETVNEPLDDWLMPMLYQYTDAGFSNELDNKDMEIWDNQRFQPDVIVINLGTNDNSYTRGINERVDYFGQKYYSFLEFVRNHNPESSIICTLGAMGQELCPEIEKQVTRFQVEMKDNNVYFMAFDVQKDEDGIGSDWHPSKVTHQKMADKLANQIQKIKNWN